MAKRKKYSTMNNKKIEPAVLTLQFEGISMSPGAGSDTFYDLSQIASVINRRFYRQGLNWAVAGFKLLSLSSGGNPSGFISINKLPNTWVMSNSWEKGFRAWDKMNKEALAESPSVRPKFLDFKIYMDERHHTAGFDANLLPEGYRPGEWSASKFSVPDTTTHNSYDREIIAVGANYPGAGASGINAISLIEGYANSRGLPNILDLNTPDDADDADGVSPENWLSALFNDGTEQTADVIDDMITENNTAPYPFENGPNPAGGAFADTQYPGGPNQGLGLQVHDQEFITGTTVGGTTRLKGGNFPCGLINVIQVNTSDSETLTTYLYVDLVPGTHRGYLCEPMTEM